MHMVNREYALYNINSIYDTNTKTRPDPSKTLPVSPWWGKIDMTLAKESIDFTDESNKDDDGIDVPGKSD